MPVPHIQLVGDAIVDVENEDIVRLLRHYRRIEQRGDGVRTADLDPAGLEWCAGKLMILRPVADHDFEYVSYGSEIEAVTGFNMVGQRVSDFTGPVGDFFRHKYVEALERSQPVYTIHRSVKTREVNTWERLILPVVHWSGARNERWLVVYNKPFSFTNSLVQKIIDETNDAIVYIESFEPDNADVGSYLLTIHNRTFAHWFDVPHDPGPATRLRDHVRGELLTAIETCASQAFAKRPDCEQKGLFSVGDKERHLRIKCSRLPPGLCLWLVDETDKKNREAELTRLAMIDPLTRVFNRLALNEAFSFECDRAERSNEQFHVAVMDIDHFKQINDQYGHDVGDSALQQVVDVTRSCIRTSDYIARLGGEEFAILMPNSTAGQAYRVAERIRAEIAGADFVLDGHRERITASLGVSSAGNRHRDDLKEAIRLADKALYQAKADGRNRVICHAGVASGIGTSDEREIEPSHKGARPFLTSA